MNTCWIIPKNAPACKRDVQFTDKRELEDGGYAKYRIAITEGATRDEGFVYVQDAIRKVNAVDWKKAAWELFGSYTGLQVFCPDGSLVVG